MKNFVIYKRTEDGLGEKIGQYTSSSKQGGAEWNYTHAEPMACHIEVPEGLDPECVQPVWIEFEPEHVITVLEPVNAQDEKWIKQGKEDIFKDPQDESWIHVPAIEEQQGLYHTIPAVWGWSVEANTSQVIAKRQAKANANLDKVRVLRELLLTEADHAINSLEDDGQSTSTWRAYRKALRECTDDLKKANGDAKLSCETLVAEEFEFPAKPE